MQTNMQTATTEDLIATIAADRDDIATFYAREEYTRRTGSDWRKWAPIKPRTWAEGVMWWNFVG
jgi:hypothetical protein